MIKRDTKSIRISSAALPKLQKISRDNGTTLIKTVDNIVNYYSQQSFVRKYTESTKNLPKSSNLYDRNNPEYMEKGFYYRIEQDLDYDKKDWLHFDTGEMFASAKALRKYNYEHKKLLNWNSPWTDEESYSVRKKLVLGWSQLLIGAYHERSSLSGFVNGKRSKKILKLTEEQKKHITQNIPSLKEAEANYVDKIRA
tara:strand:+ start:132 stop:722 length:591 start_codon:yes stop_codon:yes gene_type:complete